MAGVKGRSGRKSDAELHVLRELIDRAASDADWQAMLRKLVKLAKGGNVRAFQMLAAYRFGQPRADVALSAGDGVTLHLFLPDNGMEAASGATDGVPRV